MREFADGVILKRRKELEKLTEDNGAVEETIMREKYADLLSRCLNSVLICLRK